MLPPGVGECLTLLRRREVSVVEIPVGHELKGHLRAYLDAAGIGAVHVGLLFRSTPESAIEAAYRQAAIYEKRCVGWSRGRSRLADDLCCCRCIRFW